VNVADVIKLLTDRCDIIDITCEYIFSSSPTDEVLSLLYNVVKVVKKEYTDCVPGDEEYDVSFEYIWDLMLPVETAKIELKLS